MEEATFMAWLKNEGQTVKAGDLLFSVETDKALQEIEALDSGILHLLPNGPQPGDIIKVGDAIGCLLQPGESPPSGDPVPATAPVSGAEPVQPAVVAKADRTQPPSVPASANKPVSPRAAQRALVAGVDLRAVTGSGRGGRVRESDVMAAVGRSPVPVPAPAPAAAPTGSGPAGREVPLTSLRRTIAQRMVRSKTATAPVTLTARADVTAMVKLRADWKAAGRKEALPSYSDMIIKLTAGVLRGHPALNARWEETRIIHPDAINIGLAVDTQEGLLVPVVRDVPGLTLGRLAQRTADLVERARQRKLSAEELGGGTFTVTNLGGMGVDAFTPIINHPECAVLGIGRIVREPVAENDTVVIRDRMWLSLTFDHRLVDGAPAARFLDALRRAVENPLAGLVE